ncbi:PREDICTED: putative mediator of RNA polymerase II transcription subunit 26 [Tarenaya hassleriana]|uniref:putative mediator of RNA polymerase II transcription subunit 26 n=1 Tax=Tarenaya hassleriana TaxID=28532 RepID=UPI00053C6DE3|nr:PREDICTED: putative mediator of RNA polymerase II transcription subunit 26 [Tarenaya hassleriana]
MSDEARNANTPGGCRTADELFDYVKNNIERCIQRYMSPEEVVEHMQSLGIEPEITRIFWRQLEVENAEFFSWYYTARELVRQVNRFNLLLERQMEMMRQMRLTHNDITGADAEADPVQAPDTKAVKSERAEEVSRKLGMPNEQAPRPESDTKDERGENQQVMLKQMPHRQQQQLREWPLTQQQQVPQQLQMQAPNQQKQQIPQQPQTQVPNQQRQQVTQQLQLRMPNQQQQVILQLRMQVPNQQQRQQQVPQQLRTQVPVQQQRQATQQLQLQMPNQQQIPQQLRTQVPVQQRQQVPQQLQLRMPNQQQVTQWLALATSPVTMPRNPSAPAAGALRGIVHHLPPDEQWLQLRLGPSCDPPRQQSRQDGPNRNLDLNQLSQEVRDEQLLLVNEQILLQHQLLRGVQPNQQQQRQQSVNPSQHLGNVIRLSPQQLQHGADHRPGQRPRLDGPSIPIPTQERRLQPQQQLRDHGPDPGHQQEQQPKGSGQS